MMGRRKNIFVNLFLYHNMLCNISQQKQQITHLMLLMRIEVNILQHYRPDANGSF